MSNRWVIPGLFKAFSAFIQWDKERDLLHHEGPIFFGNRHEMPVQLRWIVNPAIGLSRHPFQVFFNPRGAGGVTDPQKLANLGGWKLLEVVGLPVDPGDPGVASIYDSGLQGLATPDPGDLPFDAAMRRLKDGAPRFGWSSLSKGTASIPDWQPPDLGGYLKDLIRGRLFKGVLEMLDQHPNPLEHAGFVLHEDDPGNTTRLLPRLLAAPGSQAVGRPARAGWHPMGLLSLSIGSDPFASLALGFGTALGGNQEGMYMVSVAYEISLHGHDFSFELADVVTVDSSLRAPAAPTGLASGLLSHSRPAQTDGPAVESIQVSWDRPERPENVPSPKITATHPASYAVGRFGPLDRQAEILLEGRPSGGWLPFAASRPKTESQVSFIDHLVRQTTIGNPVVQILGYPLPVNLTYAVAAQDLFGRWTGWQTAGTSLKMEPRQGPAVMAAELDPSGELSIDFAWDWSDRSPEFIEIKGAFEDAPANVLFDIRLDFNGRPQPSAPPAPAVIQPLALLPSEPEGPRAQLAQLPQPQSLSVAGSWGEAQDRDPSDPSTRYYRLSLQIPFSFNGRTDRTLLVQGRGQCHIQQLLLPGSNISDFSSPVRVTLFNPQPPVIQVPEAPQWASLPDVRGISRALLDWRSGASPGAAGYVVYEATETTLLSALGLPGPDLTEPFTQRLQVLRQQNLGGLRSRFRRLEPGLIKDAVYEVALPRGSKVIHFYAVTAMSPNQVESDWPQSSKSFIAVAAPRLATLAAPALQATPNPQAGTVALKVNPPGGLPVSKVVIYRTANAKLASEGVDSLGPSIPVSPPVVNGDAQTFIDTNPQAGWSRIYYRAVAWTADNLLIGEVGARSPASAPQSVVLPPNTSPDLQDLQVNLPGSTPGASLVSWTSRAPVTNTALGPHEAALEAGDLHGNPPARMSGRLDKLQTLSSQADLPAPGAMSIFRLAAPKGQPVRYLAWTQRPAAAEPFTVTVKMVDPLGRITKASAQVPVLPVLPLPQLGPISVQPVTGLIMPFSHWKVIHWQILSAIDMQQAANFSLDVELAEPGNAQPAHIHTAFSDVQVVDRAPRQLVESGMVGKVLRAKGDQPPFSCVILVTVDHAHVGVTLTDPLGRTVTQSAEF